MNKKQRLQVFVVVLLSVGVLAVDQLIKVLVKTGMYLHEAIRVTDWFYLLFTENNGMAFGMEVFPKWFLTSFRVVAVCLLAWYIARLIRNGVDWGRLICMVLIMAGAGGNIFDCLFYGLIFNAPPVPLVAEYVGWGNGYSELFLGRVVDMFYFPLVEWDWPMWMPMLGGEHFIFFSPIFHFADACISCGFVALLLFYHKSLIKE